MPFKKKGNKYESPSGRKFTKDQVKLYYANDGFPEHKEGLGCPSKSKKKSKKKHSLLGR